MARVANGNFLTVPQIRRHSRCRGAKNAGSLGIGHAVSKSATVSKQELWEAEMGNRASRFAGCAWCPVDVVSGDDVW